jgi:subtilisin family serine protease
MDDLKHNRTLLITFLIIVTMMAHFLSTQAAAANGNETKVKGSVSYTSLFSKAQRKGTVKIIVHVSAPSIPESLLQETDKQAQRAARLQIQDQVIAEIENKGHKPKRVHKYRHTPHIAMTVDSASLDALLSSPDVISIEEDIPVPPILDQSVPHIGAAELHKSNVTGAGVAVAILDTGVDKTHPFLLGSVIYEACFSSNDGSSSLCPEGVITSTAEGSAMPCGGNYITTDCDHGTHVAGIVAGRDNIPDSPGPGVAPQASIIAIQVFSRFDSYEDCGGEAPCILSFPSDQMRGLELVYDLSGTHSIASVNMSLGGGAYSSPCEDNPLEPLIASLRSAAGIATVIASGNDGYCGSISAPACSPSAISVGATTDSDSVATYSNSADFLSLLAPGSSILSSVPGGIYQSWSGTSMATPHVAGGWALMKQAYPGATVYDILSSFTSTGPDILDLGCPSVTKKRIDVYEAYSLMGGYSSLTVTKTGVGTGTVTSNLPGIDCGNNCSFWFTSDITVTLTATADVGSEFVGWSGAGCLGSDPCTISLSESSTVNALFRKEVTIGMKLTITGSNFGTGKGSVLVGDKTARIERDGWTNDTIIAEVRNVPSGSPGIFSLTVLPRTEGSTSITFEDAASVKGPEITGSNYQGHSGYPILVNGRFFGTRKPKVHLGYTDDQGRVRKMRRRVSSLYMDSTTGESRLVFGAPYNLAPGTYVLYITNKVGIAESSFTLQ